ncbi:unnamed protein product [Mytilus edulis]|uniref:Uncharacterized protein n=1 Tax=Mytilus edulis TaxID=6550 RepID=A0A8S3VCT2_MYTED|nr:unnamed protein product [Mytilus edulis]
MDLDSENDINHGSCADPLDLANMSSGNSDSSAVLLSPDKNTLKVPDKTETSGRVKRKRFLPSYLSEYVVDVVCEEYVKTGIMSEEELDYEEEENQDHLTEPKRQVAIRGEATNVRLRHRECDICLHTFTNPIRHAIQTHLPWYVVPETACWICGTQEQTANFLNKHITRCHPTNAIDATFKNREVMYAELMNGLLR